MLSKKTTQVAILVSILMLLALTGCTTTAKTSTIREPDDHYLGNFDPFQLENAMCITQSFKGELSPKELQMYFAPRQNTVEAHFQYGIDKVAVVFNLEERKAFLEGILAYMEAYNAGELPVRSPDKKNYFTRTPVSVSWGVFGLAYKADTYVRINYEYLEPGKPYFLATFENAPSKSKDDDASSPVMNLYFSPSQLEMLLEIVDQDEFQARVDELSRQAFEW